MNTRLFKKAEQIAASGYQLQVEREDEHDESPIFVAYISEIPECVAQGVSSDQAKAELQTLLVDIIVYMLESDLEVPAPETRKGSAILQAGESQTISNNLEQKVPAITGSRVLHLDRSVPHTSWAVASVPSRVLT